MKKTELQSEKCNYRSVLTLAMCLLEDCDERDILHLTDFGCNLASDGLYSLMGSVPERRHRVMLHAVYSMESEELPPVCANLYQDTYSSLENIPKVCYRGAVYLGAAYQSMTPEEVLPMVVSLTDLFSIVYFVAPRPDSLDARKWHILADVDSLRVRRFQAEEEVLLCVEKRIQIPDIRIYTVTHKDTSMPEDRIYVPLWVGAQKQNRNGWFDDKQDEEISVLNSRINECTGMYAVWKHSDAEVKGIVHYRRFFISERSLPGQKQKNASLLTGEEITWLLTRFDILVAQMVFVKQPVRVHMLEAGLKEEIAEAAVACFRRHMQEKQPAYVQAYDTVMNGHSLYPCNMLIARREIFDAYCAWLFSFLPDVAKELDFDKEEGYNKRVAGYVAERMLTVWLIRQPLRIREMEFVLRD